MLMKKILFEVNLMSILRKIIDYTIRINSSIII